MQTCILHRTVWALFLIALAAGGSLRMVGLIDISIWRCAGPMALLAVAAMMLGRPRSAA